MSDECGWTLSIYYSYIGRGGEMESAMKSLVWVFNWWVWLVIDFFI